MVLDTIVFSLVKIMMAMFAFGMGRIALIIMDRAIDKSDSRFATWIKEAPHEAKAIYYGARIIALCVLIGLAIS